jgi:Na+/proline symporter
VTPGLLFITFLLYTVLLFYITWLTARRANNQTYFIGNKASPWFVVAYGMIGASLSGVTFMSVPGWVKDTGFSYMVLVIGYLVGYMVIAMILLPLYYRLNLTSIYTYLEQRYGFWSYKTGSFFFLLSRTIGASFRIFLVVSVLQVFVFDSWHIPFWLTSLGFISLIVLYTFRGGIRTIVWTDTLQTTFMLLSVIFTIVVIINQLGVPVSKIISDVSKTDMTTTFFFDWKDNRYFLKQFLSGIFICIAMTGLDQEMMQKNLSCRNLRDAQKNMITFSIILVLVNFLFLCLGVVLYYYSQIRQITIPGTSDNLYPVIAFRHLGALPALVFVIGLISAAYPSADGALTSLTTAFSIDFLGITRKDGWSDTKKKQIRYWVHFCFALILLIIMIFYYTLNNTAIIQQLFTIAGYTYGPLLGLFAFGLFTKFSVRDKWVPLIAVISPIICYILSLWLPRVIEGYKFGFELLILNGLLTFAGLFFIRTHNTNKKPRAI